MRGGVYRGYVPLYCSYSSRDVGSLHRGPPSYDVGGDEVRGPILLAVSAGIVSTTSVEALKERLSRVCKTPLQSGDNNGSRAYTDAMDTSGSENDTHFAEGRLPWQWTAGFAASLTLGGWPRQRGMPGLAILSV